MIIYRSTNDSYKMPSDIRLHIEKVLAGERGVFDVLLGGDVFQLQNLLELKEIIIDYETGGTAADSIAPIDAVDNVGAFTCFFLATNDAGGNAYFIPNWMVDNSVVLQAIIEETRASTSSETIDPDVLKCC